jgi:hypothetical protein
MILAIRGNILSLREAFFLSRLPSHVRVYDEDNNPLCFGKIDKEMLRSGLSKKELPVFITGAGKVGVRLIMRLLAGKIYQKRIYGRGKKKTERRGGENCRKRRGFDCISICLSQMPAKKTCRRALFFLFTDCIGR